MTTFFGKFGSGCRQSKRWAPCWLASCWAPRLSPRSAACGSPTEGSAPCPPSPPARTWCKRTESQSCCSTATRTQRRLVGPGRTGLSAAALRRCRLSQRSISGFFFRPNKRKGHFSRFRQTQEHHDARPVYDSYECTWFLTAKLVLRHVVKIKGTGTGTDSRCQSDANSRKNTNLRKPIGAIRKKTGLNYYYSRENRTYCVIYYGYGKVTKLPWNTTTASLYNLKLSSSSD